MCFHVSSSHLNLESLCHIWYTWIWSNEYENAFLSCVFTENMCLHFVQWNGLSPVWNSCLCKCLYCKKLLIVTFWELEWLLSCVSPLLGVLKILKNLRICFYTWCSEMASLLCGTTHVSASAWIVRSSCHILSTRMASLLCLQVS